MKTRKRKEPVVYPFVQKTPFGRVNIYRNAEGDRVRYMVTWSSENGRQRQRFTEEVEAHQRAEEIVSDMERGVSFRNSISATKAVRIAEYERELEKHGKTLGDAVRYYLVYLEKQAATKINALEAVNEYLESIEKKDGRNYETAKHVLKKFGRSFNKNLCSITVAEIDSYIKGISSSGRTRNNHLGYLKTFFKWAKEWKGYLPNGDMEISKLHSYDEEAVKINVFTPEEIEKLLNAADDTLRPYLAIGAFAGVRCAETQRLNWEDIDFETKTIRLSPDITKTSRRRLARMSDNLVAWLNKHSETKSGPIMPRADTLHRDRVELCKKAGVAWKNNGLRKSYISYRMAQADADAIQVSKQCGNSPQMVEEHYKELVSPKIADAWFSIAPTTFQ